MSVGGVNRIFRANLDTLNLQSIVDGVGSDVEDLTVKSSLGKIYWANSIRGIQRANLDGSNVETIISGGATGIALDSTSGKIYWTGSGKIQRADLDGSNVETVITSSSGGLRGIALDTSSNKIYWTKPGAGKIRRANLDGSNAEDVLTGLDFPKDIGLDTSAGQLYWTNFPGFGNSKIQRASLSGANVETLVANLGLPEGLTLDLANQKLYWTAASAGKIQRSDLDGNNIETLRGGLTFPHAIALGTSGAIVEPIPDGPPTLEFANFEKSVRIKIHEVIEEVLSVERARLANSGADDPELFEGMQRLLDQIHPNRQLPDLKTTDLIRTGALSQDTELVIDAGAEVAALGIEFLAGLLPGSSGPVLSQLVGKFGKSIGFEIGEEWGPMRDMHTGIVEVPGTGRLGVVYNTAEDIIMLDYRLEDPVNRILRWTIPVTPPPAERPGPLGIRWKKHLSSPFLRAMADELGPIDPKIEETEVVIVSLKSPGRVKVVDEQGNVTGAVNGVINEEIPNSFVFNDVIVIFDSSLDHRYQVIGEENGQYSIDIVSQIDTDVRFFRALQMSIGASVLHEYVVSWDALVRGEEGVTLRVDSNGDGSFDQTLKSGNRLTGPDIRAPFKPAIQAEDQVSHTAALEPGESNPISSASVALGSGADVMEFNVQDVDPQADNPGDVVITDITVDNLGTADDTDIAQVAILDDDDNLVASPVAPTGGPHANIPFQATFSGVNFTIPDDQEEAFTIAVRTASTHDLSDDDQGNTLQLKVTLTYAETQAGVPVGSGGATATVTDSAVEHIWNGGINEVTDDLHTTEPIEPGSQEVVSQFTICDEDANQHNLVLDGVVVRQGEQGTALHSDITNLILYRRDGQGRTELASLTPTDTFNRGGPGEEILSADAHVYVQDDGCASFDLVARVSAAAFTGKTIQPVIHLSSEEPEGTAINASVDPQVVTDQPTAIGTGAVQAPSATILAEPTEIPIRVAGLPLPGLGTLQVGPQQSLTFDPSVLKIHDIIGVGDYTVESTKIDNRRGEAQFTVRLSTGSAAVARRNGPVALLKLEGIGDPGQRTSLDLSIDRATDADGAPLTKDLTTVNGQLYVTTPGDVDGDFKVSIHDSLILSRQLLDGCPDLSDQQKRIADVAAPTARTGEIPTCTGSSPTLTSSDVAEIAKLSLASAASLPLQVSQVHLKFTDHGSISVQAEGQGVRGIKAKLYDLSGRRLAQYVRSGGQLTIPLQSAQGRRLANGVYLVSVTVNGRHGQIHREARLFAQLR